MPGDRSFAKFLTYVFVRWFDFWLGLIPFGPRAYLTERFGLLIYHTSSRYRNLVLRHLLQAFPESDEAWRERVARANFRHMGRLLAEIQHTPRINESFFRRWFVARPAGEEHAEIFRKGGIAILGHLGNWEWHGVAASRLAGRPVHALVKRHPNFWSNRFLEESRGSQGVKIIYVDQNPIIGVKLLRRGEYVAYTSDQDARSHGMFVEFMNRPASTFMGPAVTARHTDVPIHFLWSYRDERFRLVFEYEELPRPKSDPADIEAWEREFTETWTRKLEEKIRLHPEYYLWAHNRWKTQPE